VERSTGARFIPVPRLGIPVFRRDRGDHVVFYAPGYVAVAAASRAAELESSLASAGGRDPTAASLVEHAERAEASHRVAATAPYEPVCLMLYLGNRCNLRCSYCYASPTRGAAPRLDRRVVQAAAERVLASCERRGLPLTVVFHGGGEPTLFPGLIERLLDALEQTARARGVPVFRYLATNGVLPAARARRLVSRFDTVGLSCDGPQPLQTAQRPTWSGRPSTPFVERTADIVRAEGARLHVRVTVTRQTLRRQPAIARYLCERIRPAEIVLEPVYSGGRTARGDSLRAGDAAAFVDGFLAARDVAAGFGVRVLTSGSRASEIHGPYCNLLRDVLQLVPGGAVTACFKATDATASAARGMTIGHCDGNGSRLSLDRDRTATLQRSLAEWPGRCRNCFNRFHCTLGCPDSCPAETKADPSEFRCRMQMALTLQALDEAAAAAWAQGKRGRGVAGHEVLAP
jgi:sulfatase maturation enzyme AslB (radical SAM superfamily)